MVTKTNPKKVLLVHHKKFNKWMQPGGHVEPFENYRDAAVREAKEETGLDISTSLPNGPKVDDYAFTIPTPQYLMEQRIPAYGEQPEHFHVDSMFVITLDEQSVSRAEAESHGIGWFTLNEALKLEMYENTRWLLRQVLA